MAVYTHVEPDDLAALVARYDIGTVVSCKGIAEGVENSNFLLETTGGRFILTLYEKRVDVDDLPFFIAFTDHLADRGCPVPRILADQFGQHIQTLSGRPACLIEFLPGVSPSRPTPRQTFAAGAALAELHNAAADFAEGPPNPLSLDSWHILAERIGDRMASIHLSLPESVAQELAFLDAHWPQGLAESVIHADFFPDNVLMRDETVTGIIDFYFSCRDITVYDFVITHSAWCFSADGSHHQPSLTSALATGYQRVRPFTEAEKAALPVLARGCALRFLLTRALDWLETPPDALVVRKDPFAYQRRLDFYRTATTADILGE